MRRFYQVIVASGLLLLLGACAKTTAFEPQDQALDPRLSRIYFFRQARSVSDAGGIATAEIRVDGKVIGKFGSAGKLPKQFGLVNSMDCRNENELLVGEMTNWRVQKITLRPAR